MQRIRKRSKFNRRRNSLRCRGSGREVELTGRGEAKTQRNMRRSKIKMQSNRKISGMNRRKRCSMRCRATEGEVV